MRVGHILNRTYPAKQKHRVVLGILWNIYNFINSIRNLILSNCFVDNNFPTFLFHLLFLNEISGFVDIWASRIVLNRVVVVI